MRQRCYDERHSNFKNYGARGIKICERWLDSYENFLADMGRKPSPRHSIDREDNDGDYEPGNCRWATPSEQALNKRPLPPGHGFPLGEAHPNSKLTVSDILEIRRSNLPHGEIAGRYGVYRGTIVKIRNRFTWVHV
jgi:hypothetical protein